MKTMCALILLTASFGKLFAASYDTLPKGVNTAVFKQVMLSKVQSEYNANGEQKSLDLKEEFSSSRLEDLSSVIKTYFNELKALSPEAYSQFSLGEFSADIDANVTAQGFGYGHGITDRLTVYAAIPLYHVKTNVNFKQTRLSTINNVHATLMRANPDTAFGKFVKDLTLQLPNTNAELLQSLVVNYYGYRPIGKWEKDALGDAEIGAIYRLTDFADRGLALTIGAVLPTGDVDDPDSLQDVATGDGQYDAFVESSAGISFEENKYQLDLVTRFTYQFASTKHVRWIEDANVPLAKQKYDVKEKLGNKIDAALTFTYNHRHWISFNSAFVVNYLGQASYDNVSNSKVRNALEADTDSIANWIKLGVAFSSVESFKRKKFDIPFDVGLNAQKMITAKNAYSYTRFDLDFKMYF